jgi:hypothetical protein
MPLSKKQQTVKKENSKRGPTFSPFSKEFYMHYKGMTLEEATKEAKTKRPCNVEYWIKKGFSVDASILKVKDHQKKTSIIRVEKVNNGELIYFGPNQTEYWKNRGFTDEEAILKVSERQSTFSKVKLIEKLGEERGLARWKERQIKWQKTLGEKSKEEISEINRKKLVTLSNMQEKYGEVLGEEKYNIWKNSHNMFSSKEATEFFKKITDYIVDNFQVNRKQIYFEDNDNNEMFLKDNDGKHFLYDYCVRDLFLIIEYHGIKFHPNKDKLSEEEWAEWKCLFSENTAEYVYSRDQYKKKLAMDCGFSFFEVFSDDPDKFNRVIEFIRKHHEDNNRHDK